MTSKTVIRTVTMSIVLIAVSVTVFAQQALTVGQITAKAGEKQTGFIIVPAGEDGPEQHIPVTVINGSKSGPVLALTAGVHGYEYPPVLALQRLGKKIEPDQISGALILVHVANMPSFMKRTIYYNPYDWMNLNRAFPGKVDGTMCERIAYQITKEVIDPCDALVDCHCGDGNEDLTSYLYCTITGKPVLDKKIRDLAISFGLKIIVEDNTRPNDQSGSIYCANTAITRGKPAITIESGGLGRTDEKDVVRILKGATNVMKHLGMIPGKPERTGEPVWVKEYTIIRSEHDGTFFPLKGRGYHAQKGELVGYLTNFFGDTIQEVRSPYDGIVLYIIATPPLSTGEPMTMIGRF